MAIDKFEILMSIRDLASGSLDNIMNGVQDVKEEVTSASMAMQTFAIAMGSVGASLSLGNSIAEAKTFSRAIGEVATLVDTSVVSVKDLGAAVKEMSITYGEDQTGVAKALYEAISAGAEAGTQANKLLETSLKTAIGGVTTAETAVNGLTSILNAYGMSLDEAENVGDKMFATMKAGTTTIDQLANSLYQVAPMASAAGIKFDEILALTIAMTLQGTKTAETMTRIRAALQGMTTDESAVRMWRRLGFASADAAVKTLGLHEAMKIVRKEAGGNSQVMQQLVGSVEAVQAIMATTGDKSALVVKGFEAIRGSAGALTTASNQMAQTLDAHMNRAATATAAASAAIGTAIEPMVKFIVTGIAEAMAAINEFVSAHETLVLVGVAALGTLSAAWSAFSLYKLIALTGIVGALKGAFGLLIAKMMEYTIVANAATLATGKLAAAKAAAAGAIHGLTGAMTGTITKTALLKAGLLFVGEAAIKASGLILKGIGLLAKNPLILAVTGIVALGTVLYNAISEVREAEDGHADSVKKLHAAVEAAREVQAARIEVYGKYKDTVVKGEQEIAQMSLRDLKLEREKIAGAKQHADAQVELFRITKDIMHIKQTPEEALAHVAAIETSEKYAEALRNIDAKMDDYTKKTEAAYLGTNKLIRTMHDAKIEAGQVGNALTAMMMAMDFNKTKDAITMVQALGSQGRLMAEAFEQIAQQKGIPAIINLINVMNEQFKKGEMLEMHFKEASTALLGGLFAAVGVKQKHDLDKMDKNLKDGLGAMLTTSKVVSSDINAAILGATQALTTTEGIDNYMLQVKVALEQGAISAKDYAFHMRNLKETKKEVSDESKRFAAILTVEERDLRRSLATISRGYAASKNDASLRQQRARASQEVSAALGKEDDAMSANIRGLKASADLARQVAREKNQLAAAAEASYRKMEAEAATLRDSITPAQQEALDTAKDYAKELRAQADAAEVAAKAERRLADAIAKKQETERQQRKEQQEQIKQAGSSAADVAADMSNHLANTTNEVASLGEKVKLYFQSMGTTYTKGFDGATSSTKKLQQAQENLGTYMDARMKTIGPGPGVQISKWMLDLSINSEKAKIAFYEQSVAAESLIKKLGKMEFATKATTNGLLAQVRGLKLLDDSTLEALKSQIESVKQASDALFASITDTVKGLRAELANYRGDLAKAAQMEYETKAAELYAELAKAKKSGNAQAAQEAQESISILNTLHAAKMKAAKTEMAENRKAKAEESKAKREERRAAADDAASLRRNLPSAVNDTEPLVPSLESKLPQAPAQRRSAVASAAARAPTAKEEVTSKTVVEFKLGTKITSGVFGKDAATVLLNMLSDVQARA